MRNLAVATFFLTAAFLWAGCGGEKAPGTVAESVPAPPTTPAVTTRAPTETPSTAPAPASTSATAPTSSAVTAPPDPRPTDCDALGINREQGREGPCTNGDLAVHVANRGTTVALDELSVRLNGVGVLPAPDGGVHANASLTVTNNLERPGAFDARGNQVVLTLGARRYAEDISVDAAPGIARP